MEVEEGVSEKMTEIYRLTADEQRVMRRALRRAAKLLPEQEPLGEEFERVLQDNLWSLYAKG